MDLHLSLPIASSAATPILMLVISSSPTFLVQDFGQHSLPLVLFTLPSNPGPSKPKPKKASQIAKELSDLVVYTHAVKFRGLSMSPNMSLKQKKIPSRRSILTASVGTSPSTPTLLPDKSDTMLQVNIPRIKRCEVPACYEVSSLNENKAKQLCRRSPLATVTYPLLFT
ncbi:phosphoinositide phospholipase C [Elysia marginata]|uniref:Phosphoinositide phospholipase C n=1 Tax=Elysia marginata TaxID=1093978 RepID=A0AAV4EGF1_9GAST|nr:phosphoinositide phospholipase C [Elysia marginata]